MNLFKKCRKKNFKKREYKLESKTQKINIGKTYIELTFNDGSFFQTCVTGKVAQSAYDGYDECSDHPCQEPRAYPLTIVNSSLIAQSALSYLIKNSTFLDDPENPKVCKSGKVIRAEITDTEDFEIEFNEYTVVLNNKGEVK